MIKRTTQATLLAVVVAASLLVLVGCSDATSSPLPSASSSPDPATSSKLAPGLYDLEDGTVQAVGKVEFRDLEGGFWAAIGGSEAEGDVGKVVAVVANGAEYAQRFKELQRLSVVITGTRLDGASTRMAGPEIEATSVVAASEAAGPAE